jgi:hypothetical protein
VGKSRDSEGVTAVIPAFAKAGSVGWGLDHVMRKHLIALACAAIAAASITVLSCANRPDKIRHHCLKNAHRTVKVPEVDSKNRESMVRELYLRCLDVYGIPDAEPRAGRFGNGDDVPKD